MTVGSTSINAAAGELITTGNVKVRGGTIYFGTAYDASLYREDASNLKTNENFASAGSITATGNLYGSNLSLANEIVASNTLGAVAYYGAQQSIVGGAWRRLYFNNSYDQYDNGISTEVHNGTYTDRFYAPVTGLYVATMNVEWTYSSVGARFIRINNSSGTCLGITSKVPTNPDYQSLTVIAYLTTNQYLYAEAYHNDGTNDRPIRGQNTPYGLSMAIARIA